MRNAHVLQIALFGLFGCGNTGNDGSLEAALAFLRVACPDAVVTCICANPERIERTFGIRALGFGLAGLRQGLMDRLLPRKLENCLRIFRHRRDFDVLLFPGTGILDDFGAGPWSIPLTILGWCLAARIGGARIAFVSIGAGPIHHPVSRRLMKWAARLAQYRSYRDTVSRQYMDGIGFDVRGDEIFPDLAFGLPVPNRPARPAGARLVVGVGVMSYYGWSHDRVRGHDIYTAYLGKLRSFVQWLLDQGHGVRLLMGDTEDRAAVDDLMGMLAPGAVVAAPALSLHEVMEHIAETDVVVATRFHNVVCALKLGRPTVSISYASKNDALLADMGLGEFCQQIETFDVGLLIDQFTRLVRDRASHERQIRQVVQSYAERLRRQEITLATDVLNHSGAAAISGPPEHLRETGVPL
ncbi:MAG TPA: polysaccharide pyruvyl transferase family protein [Magnetospirillum sp.]|nr:polysaccharide pyruvyl transferase family protein [Magnetospirillum sp.]